MQSSFYRVRQDQSPTHEWFRPKSAGEKKKITDPSTAEHVRLGGLLLRKLFKVH